MYWEWKELLRWNKKHFSSILKSFHWRKNVENWKLNFSPPQKSNAFVCFFVRKCNIKTESTMRLIICTFRLIRDLVLQQESFSTTNAYGGKLNKQISLTLINKIMIYGKTMTKMCDNSHLPPMDEILLSLREKNWTYM